MLYQTQVCKYYETLDKNMSATYLYMVNRTTSV